MSPRVHSALLLAAVGVGLIAAVAWAQAPEYEMAMSCGSHGGERLCLVSEKQLKALIRSNNDAVTKLQKLPKCMGGRDA